MRNPVLAAAHVALRGNAVAVQRGLALLLRCLKVKALVLGAVLLADVLAVEAARPVGTLGVRALELVGPEVVAFPIAYCREERVRERERVGERELERAREKKKRKKEKEKIIRRLSVQT